MPEARKSPINLRQMDEVMTQAQGVPEAFVVRAHSVALATLKEKFPEVSGLTSAERLEALRDKLPKMLWHDLNRLRILRNSIDHENIGATAGDALVVLGTLKNLKEFLRLDEAHTEMPRRDWRAFQDRAKSFFEREVDMELDVEVEIILPDGRAHRFDLVSRDRDVAIECKSYTWTKTGNEPSAKLAQARNDAEMLRSLSVKRKIIVFEDDLRPRDGKSLAELFRRWNGVYLFGVEVWRYLPDQFEALV